jgi:phosphoribosylcarboxyaminoimidazole (NCAIR) mutase
MIWKGTHLSIIGPTVDRARQSKTQAMRLKELSVELRDRIVSRHRSGEEYQKMSAAWKVPKNTVASILLQ